MTTAVVQCRRRGADGHRRRPAVDHAARAGDPHPVRRGRGQRGCGERRGTGSDRGARVAGDARVPLIAQRTGPGRRHRQGRRRTAADRRVLRLRPDGRRNVLATAAPARRERHPAEHSVGSRARQRGRRRGDRGIERRRVADRDELVRRRARRRVEGDAARGDGPGETPHRRSPRAERPSGGPGRAVEGELDDATVGAAESSATYRLSTPGTPGSRSSATNPYGLGDGASSAGI